MYIAFAADAHLSEGSMKFRVSTRRLTLCSRGGQHFSPFKISSLRGKKTSNSFAPSAGQLSASRNAQQLQRTVQIKGKARRICDVNVLGGTAV